ncbi:uncharacterized protein N7503_010411 [Penicillium pulvis]|uniref:uncharacterized protein n=1 Tax=Penicillium pulvis TaxID=1562058 RepID=UPI00254827D5|nr:uncharacterized protein N7503_010411 [Penicillium pulvis]KAJ5785199.1 hypothetical protein N7503_010411 [Penicillium pulvis]
MSPAVENGGPAASQAEVNGKHKPTENGSPSGAEKGTEIHDAHRLASGSPEQGLGILVEHSQDDTNGNGRMSVVDVFEGPKIKAVLAELAEDASQRPADDKILKLSPEKIQELTSSPESIPYRAELPDASSGRRIMSDNLRSLQGLGDRSSVTPDVALQPFSEPPSSPNGLPKIRRPSKDPSSDELHDSINLRQLNNGTIRSRPQPSRTFSTPVSRRPTLSTPNNDRLSQTWASRSKQDRELKTQLAASPHITETPLTSPIPSVPLPPASIPTYLQLELASGRPSPLYIHGNENEFPYESSSAKIERLMNFLFLPPVLEQAIGFGSLACLDAWLYSFTILPLRFIKALYILCESWVLNLAAEARFLWKFVINGAGRVWRRRKYLPDRLRDRRESEPDATRLPNGMTTQEPRHQDPSKKRHRTSESRRHHRRKKSIPSALLPDDKADILTGLLMITTCLALMYFDASRMYHWIRGQAAIKLYVIYNVLEVLDKLLAALGQDVLECLFSREALERRPNGRSKIFRPFWLFLLALVYTVAHSISLFYQVMTLNVAVNSYSNALITLLLSNQFVEIKSTVFRKFEKENLFQLTCSDVVERFQLWLMLTIIASRNIVETGAFNFIGLGLAPSFSGKSTSTNSTPLSTPPRTSSSILPQSFTFFPSSILSLSHMNSFIPTLAQVLGPFLIVLGSEMFVDWLKHAYISKFNNYRPALYNKFLDVLAKDYYTNAFAGGDHNITRRLGLPVIPLSCIFFRVSVQTYQMFLASLLPQYPSSTAVTSSLSTIQNRHIPPPLPSAPPLSFATILPNVNILFRKVLENAIPSPAQSVQIFTVVLLLTAFIVLLILKLILGMGLLAFARSRYRKMKRVESEQRKTSRGSAHPQSQQDSSSDAITALRKDEFTVEGGRRSGLWGMVEVGDEKRKLIYGDDPEGLRRVKEKEDQDKNKDKELKIDHVQRYEMVAKKIW